MVNVPCALIGPVIKDAVNVPSALFRSFNKTLPVTLTNPFMLA